MEREDELDDKVQAAAEEMEAEIEALEKHSDEVGEEIEATEAEWKRKQADPAVPGAEPDDDEDAGDEAGE
jgi:chaperonin cofactor prefoldin